MNLIYDDKKYFKFKLFNYTEANITIRLSYLYKKKKTLKDILKME